MGKLSARAVGEIVAVISVVLSLVFVGLQLRQSTAATQAAAYQELGIATSDMLFDLSSRSELLANMALSGRDIESLESLSSADLAELRMFVQGILRLYETAYLQVETGILAPDSLDYLGWENYRNSSSLKNLWPSLRQSLNPIFAEYIENSWD